MKLFGKLACFEMAKVLLKCFSNKITDAKMASLKLLPSFVSELNYTVV